MPVKTGDGYTLTLRKKEIATLRLCRSACAACAGQIVTQPGEQSPGCVSIGVQIRHYP